MRATRVGALALLPITDASMADRDPIPASAGAAGTTRTSCMTSPWSSIGAGGQFAQALPEIEAGTAALQRATAEFSSLATP